MHNSSEEQYNILFDNSPQPMWIYDKDTLAILAVNKSAVQMYGYTKDEFLSKSLMDLRPEEELEKFFENVAKTPPYFEKSGPWLHKKKDGSVISVEVTSNDINYDGKLRRVVLLTDVTNRIEADKNRAQLAAIVQTSEDAIYSKDFNNIFLSWNKGAENIYGYTAKEIIGKNATILYPQENELESFEILNQIKQGIKVRQYETLQIKKNNDKVYVSITFSPLSNEKGELTACAVISRDITRRKKNEREVLKAFEREKIALTKAENQKIKLQFLAEASNLLNSSLDYEETLAALGTLVTPSLADWFAVDIFNENNKLVRITVSHERFVKYKFAEKFMETLPSFGKENTAIYKAVKSKKSILFSQLTLQDLKQNVTTDEQFRILRFLKLHSAMIVPLIIRDKVLGVLIFINAESKLNYSNEDLTFAEDLASRAAIAIENAALYKQQSQLNQKLDNQIQDLTTEIQNRQRAEKESEEHQKKLLQSEQRLSLVLDATNVGIWSLDITNNKLNWTDATKAQFGLSPSDEINLDLFYEYMLPEDVASDMLAIQKSIEEKIIYDHEFWIKLKSGEIKWIKSLGKCSYDSLGNPIRFDGVSIDLTESKNVQQEKLKLLAEIERQQDRLNKLVADVPGVVWEAWGAPDAANQRVDFVSGYVEEMLGYSVEEWLSNTNFWLTIVHPDDKVSAAEEAKNTFQSKEPGGSQFRWIKKNGEILWVESHVAPIIDDDGNPVGMRGVTMDISERIKHEERVQHLGSILENSLNEIYIYDAATLLFTLANHGARKNTGYSMDELKYLSPVNLKPDFTIEEYKQLINPLLSGEKEEINFTTKQKRKDGSLYDVEVHLQYSNLQAPPVFFAIIQDITQRKRAEENLQASLEEKEVLLREIHHRVKNNLQIISSLLNLQSSYIKDEKAFEYFLESQNRIKSMALIHEKLYRPMDLSRINFSDYLEDLISYLSSMYKRDNNAILFNTDIDDVYMNMDIAINLGLIINELVSNSLKYAFPQNRFGQVNINLHELNSELILSVDDNGIGLPENFNINSNNSLGLTLVEAFTKQLKGKFEILDSEGTKANIIFPKPEKEQYN